MAKRRDADELEVFFPADHTAVGHPALGKPVQTAPVPEDPLGRRRALLPTAVAQDLLARKLAYATLEAVPLTADQARERAEQERRAQEILRQRAAAEADALAARALELAKSTMTA